MGGWFNPSADSASSAFLHDYLFHLYVVPGRGHVEPLEVLGVEEREHDHLLERTHVALQPAHAAPVQRRIHTHRDGIGAAWA